MLCEQRSIMPTSNQSIHIRSAEHDDDWAVRQLFGALHAFNASLDPRFALADGWEQLLDEHLALVRETDRGLTLLAWDADEPVGLIMMDRHTDSRLFRHRQWVELLAIYVAPQVRGGSLARQLLAMGTTWAVECGYDRIQLYVTASNERAKEFYQRAGFKPVQEIWRLELDSNTHQWPGDMASFPDQEPLFPDHHDWIDNPNREDEE